MFCHSGIALLLPASPCATGNNYENIALAKMNVYIGCSDIVALTMFAFDYDDDDEDGDDNDDVVSK